MKSVNVHDAKSSLSTLLAQVEKGEEIVIARNGAPVARLVAYQAPAARVPGSWRALPGWSEFRYDAATFAALTGDEISQEGWL